MELGNIFTGLRRFCTLKMKTALMLPGTTFTIEPILSVGGQEIEIQDDLWTATTVDNARTAQFEHTVLITDNGVEILTLPD